MKVNKVTVFWYDARYEMPGWHDKQDFYRQAEQTIPLSETTGYLVHKCKAHIVIALSIGDECIADCIKIPTGCIKRIETLGYSGITLSK